MKNTNLVQILSTFDNKEIKEFGEFVRSEFFNKNESVIKLYDLLRKYHPFLEEDKIVKEEVHRKIFPGTKYNDGFMRKIIFNLSRLAEQYLTYKKSVEHPVEAGVNLLSELNNRKLDKLFTKHFSEIKNELERSGDKNHSYYRRRYTLEALWANYTDNIRYKVDLHDKREYHNERIKEKLFYFTNYFLLYSLDTYRTLKYQGYADRFEINDEFLDSITAFLLRQLNAEGEPKADSYINNLIIRVYLYEIMLMRNKNGKERLAEDIYYARLKKILKEETKDLPHDSRFSLFNILIQHCTGRIMRGYSEYRSERFELDKIALSQGIYMSQIETDFPPPTFASMVRDACEMNDFRWAEELIKKYKSRLEPLNNETVLNLSYALMHFYKNEFQKALDYLNKIKPVKRWEFKFAVKELTLQIFYELSMFTQAYYLIDSFRHFISSMAKNFSSERIESRNNFLKYYSVLLRLKESPEKREIRRIADELEDADILIYNRDWLREKAGKY
jgi:hypothetical protein